MTHQANVAHLRRSPAVLLKAMTHNVLCRLGLSETHYRGAFATYEEALAAVPSGMLAGYDHEEIADVCFEKMCRVALWDWPVLYWLRRLGSEVKCVLDAGGHQGTKFRAFRNHLELGDQCRWVIYDVPSMVRAGRARACREGLRGLDFVDNLANAPDADVLLASGLLQYLDQPFPDLAKRLPALPRHLILNKVATRKGPAVVTLEQFGRAEVPYQIRNHDEFVSSLQGLGYDIVDQWQIPDLSHGIPSHPHLGVSTSCGFYARLD